MTNKVGRQRANGVGVINPSNGSEGKLQCSRKLIGNKWI